MQNPQTHPDLWEQAQTLGEDHLHREEWKYNISLSAEVEYIVLKYSQANYNYLKSVLIKVHYLSKYSYFPQQAM